MRKLFAIAAIALLTPSAAFALSPWDVSSDPVALCEKANWYSDHYMFTTAHRSIADLHQAEFCRIVKNLM